MNPIEKVRISGTWNLAHEDGAITAPVPVPGSVYEALIETGTIDDPFYGENEHQMAWVYESSWHFETTVDVGDRSKLKMASPISNTCPHRPHFTLPRMVFFPFCVYARLTNTGLSLKNVKSARVKIDP